MRYVDNYLRPTETYPSNPNGSPCGIAGEDLPFPSLYLRVAYTV